MREVRPMISIRTRPDTSGKYDLDIVPNLADHVLATGPRYMINDIKTIPATHLGINTSGVLSKIYYLAYRWSPPTFFFHLLSINLLNLLSVLGINHGTRLAYKIREAQSMRTFHITGRFGISTENNFKNSVLISKATYTHIYQNKVDALVAAMQASHQKKMFEMCGVDLQSQTAYELACKGIIRPAKKDCPVIYGIRCIKFDRPDFVLEVDTINENEEYLCTLIQEIGIQMRSVAHCTGLRCVRHGHFGVEQSLLRGHWRLQSVLSNLKQCAEILRDHPDMIQSDNPEVVMQKRIV